MSNDPWGEDPVFQEILEDIKQADETQLSTMLQQQKAMIRELQQLNQNQQYERSTDTSTDTSSFPDVNDLRVSGSELGSGIYDQPLNAYNSQQQGGEFMEQGDLMRQEASSVLGRMVDSVEQNLGYGNEIHTNQPPPPGNDYTARGQQEPFFTPPQSERQRQQLAREQQQTSGEGGATVEPGQEQRQVSQQQAQQQIQEELPTNDPRAEQELPSQLFPKISSLVSQDINTPQDFNKVISEKNTGVKTSKRQKGIAWHAYKRKKNERRDEY
jgi:hypothetical protein